MIKFVYHGRFSKETKFMKNNFTTTDIVKALGIPRERLRSWTKLGYIKPSMPSGKQGRKVIFTRADVYAVALFDRLINLGFKREDAARLVQFYISGISEGILEYIVFRPYFTSSGNKAWQVFPLDSSKKKLTIKLKNALFYGEEVGLAERTYPQLGKLEDWESLLIVNGNSLKRKTDEHLSMLE
jgi:DNA-binding transcriptional MerR regulator